MHILPNEQKLAQAEQIYSNSDWDQDTISVALPADHAYLTLVALGWTYAIGGGWTSPAGVKYWQADEALRVALSAFALSMDTLGSNTPSN